MRDDRLAVANRLAVIDDIRKLPARRPGGVEDMLMDERHACQLEEGKHLQPIAIIVGDAEQFRIGVERQHRLCIRAVPSETSASMLGTCGLINGLAGRTHWFIRIRPSSTWACSYGR